MNNNKNLPRLPTITFLVRRYKKVYVLGAILAVMASWLSMFSPTQRFQRTFIVYAALSAELSANDQYNVAPIESAQLAIEKVDILVNAIPELEIQSRILRVVPAPDGTFAKIVLTAAEERHLSADIAKIVKYLNKKWQWKIEAAKLNLNEQIKTIGVLENFYNRILKVSNIKEVKNFDANRISNELMRLSRLKNDLQILVRENLVKEFILYGDGIAEIPKETWRIKNIVFFLLLSFLFSTVFAFLYHERQVKKLRANE